MPCMVGPAPLPANGRGLRAAAARDARERERRENAGKEAGKGAKSWRMLRNAAALLVHSPSSHLGSTTEAAGRNEAHETHAAPVAAAATRMPTNALASESVPCGPRLQHAAYDAASDARTKATDDAKTNFRGRRVAWAAAAMCPEHEAALGKATAERNATYAMVKKARDGLALFGDALTGFRVPGLGTGKRDLSTLTKETYRR